MRKKGRVAKLTPAEDRAWVDAFNHAIEQSKSARQADIYAAKAVCQQFPRLKGYAKFAPQEETPMARTFAGPVRDNARTADEKLFARMPTHLTGMQAQAEWLFLHGYSGPGMEPFRHDPVMQLRRRNRSE